MDPPTTSRQRIASLLEDLGGVRAPPPQGASARDEYWQLGRATLVITTYEDQTIRVCRVLASTKSLPQILDTIWEAHARLTAEPDSAGGPDADRPGPRSGPRS